MVEIPLHIYAKHQYKQESKYRNTWYYTIQQKKNKYRVTSEGDIIFTWILHYKRHKIQIYKVCTEQKDAYELQGESHDCSSKYA